MTRFPITAALAGALLFAAPSHAQSTQAANVQAALEETLVRAAACRTIAGNAWDPLVADARVNLDAYLAEQSPAIPRAQRDARLARLTAQGRAQPASAELREHCRQVMASGG